MVPAMFVWVAVALLANVVSSRSILRRDDSPSPGWTLQSACIADNSNRLLQMAYVGPQVNISTCTAFCGSYSYTLTGTENGNECWCGNYLNTTSAGQTLPTSSCNVPCAGDAVPGQTLCGGPYALTLYNYTAGYVGFPPGWALQSACVTDSPNGRLLSTQTLNTSLTPALCASICDGQGAVYAGLQYSDECWCGNSLNTAAGAGAPSNACTSPCAGDSTMNCGGAYAIRLYAKNGGATPSSSSSVPSSSSASSTSITSSSTTIASSTILSSSTSISSTIASSSTSASTTIASSSTSASTTIASSSTSVSTTIVPSSTSSSASSTAGTSSIASSTSSALTTASTSSRSSSSTRASASSTTSTRPISSSSTSATGSSTKGSSSTGMTHSSSTSKSASTSASGTSKSASTSASGTSRSASTSGTSRSSSGSARSSSSTKTSSSSSHGSSSSGTAKSTSAHSTTSASTSTSRTNSSFTSKASTSSTGSKSSSASSTRSTSSSNSTIASTRSSTTSSRTASVTSSRSTSSTSKSSSSTTKTATSTSTSRSSVATSSTIPTSSSATSTIASMSSTASSSASSIPTAGPPQVDLGYSVLQGSYDPALNISSFLGVRYAAPPVRWRAPQDPLTTTGIVNVTTEPNSCYTANMGQSSSNPYRAVAFNAGKTDRMRKRQNAPQSEDCLFMNIFTPGLLQNQTATGKLLPVIVYIHGGGLVSGGANAWPSMEDMVLESYGNIIGLQMQYRLGMWGFLPGQRVADDGVLNAGLLDQQFALQWVQKHISKFGGDPSAVTIWGESSGAFSVMQHLVAHGGNTQPPLFRAAMSSSSVLQPQYVYNDIFPEALWNFAATSISCSTMDCLRNAPVDALNYANNVAENWGYYHTSIWAPVIDGSLIVERPSLSLSKGNVNGAGIYVVHNENEGGAYFVPPKANISDFVAQQMPFLSSAQVNQVISFYNPLYSNDADRMGRIVGDGTFICSDYYISDGFKNKISYKGRFQVGLAKHADDLGYEFARMTTPDAVAQYTADPFRQSFVQAFISFAVYMDPNHKIRSTTITPPWSQWTTNNPNEMFFNKTADGSPNIFSGQTEQGLLNRCAFWKNFQPITWQ